MLIRIGYEPTFKAPARTPMLLMLYKHPSRAAPLRRPDHFEPYVPVREFRTWRLRRRCGAFFPRPDERRNP